MRRINILLLGIILLASVLRLWNLAFVPPSASLDESSIGYNAYSVVKTGGDEFGSFPLISQRGYDDYRRSTYLLLVVPFVSLFGLNVISVRLPAVILSILTVWAVYEIAKRFVWKKNGFNDQVGLLSAFFLAISPWHIYISRIGHESNACLSFFVFAVLFFFKGLEKTKFLLIAVIFFALSMVSYYSGQVLVPLFVLALIIIYRKQIFKTIFLNTKTRVITLLIFFIAIPVIWSVFSPEALIRFRGTSTFSPSAHEKLFNERVLLRNRAVANHDIIGSIYYNQHLFPAVVLVQGYLDHFNPVWIFSNDSSGMFKAPHVGLLYPWQILFILIGFVGVILTKKVTVFTKFLLITWVLLGALPASIATQTPHAMRSYNILPTWEFFTGFGVYFFAYKFSKFKRIIFCLIVIISLFFLLSFVNNYFFTFPKEQSKSFQYAYGKALQYVIANQNNYKHVVVSNTDNMFQSYMIFLYYSKYDPSLYQKQGGSKSGGFDASHKFGKFEFRPINWVNEKTDNTLYVLNPNEVPEGSRELFVGKYLNGTKGAIVIAR